MQIVIVQQDPIFVDGAMLDRWDVQLLNTGKVVAQIKELTGNKFELITYGDRKYGNRYRSFDGLDKTTDVTLSWAKRRFSSK